MAHTTPFLSSLVVGACLLLPVAGARGQTSSLPGTDIRTWSSADLSSRLSFAGTWAPVDSVITQGGLVGPFWNVVRLGPAQREGVALGGWMFNGSFQSTLKDVVPVRAALFAQQDDGTLRESSAATLGNNLTNGAGSVLVADFNGDGMDDLVFPAHNESPFLWKSSTAWMSGPGGTYTRIILPDAVMNHDAKVVVIDGKKKILSRSFGGSGNNGNGAGFNVIYTWNGANFTVDTSLGDMGGMSVLAGPFTGNADNWLIIGDSNGGLGIPWSATNPMLNYAYKFIGGIASLPPIPLPKPYFNDKQQYAGYVSEWDPYSKSHTSRLWATDLNQDGLPDILAGQEIWTSKPAGLQKAVFQLLVNRGNMVFEDLTDALGPEFSQDSYIDYNVRLVDVDGSGIDTMFLSSNPAFSAKDDAAKQGQYVLVNDGTGRLYAAMHDEFRAMGPKVTAYLQSKLPSGSGTNTEITPQYIAYRNAAGALNFLAVSRAYSTAQPQQYGMVNVALQVNLATDFRRDLTVSTRNGSRRIRTFAGNDTIHRALSDPDCAIDGGLGTNTVVYPGKRGDWVVAPAGEKVTVRPASGPGGTDTLTRIQFARFDDATIDLTKLAAEAPNYTALWWNPAESGWGVNFNHQGSTLFATLFTYDASGAPMWLVMSGGQLQSDGATFSGALYRTTGPAFNASPFTPIGPANITPVGTFSVAFQGPDSAIVSYSYNGTPVTKSIRRQVFGSRAASCVSTTASRASLANFQDLWWKPDESGWGINFTHQDQTLFATLFTYDARGQGLWLVMSGGVRQPDGSYSGDLFRTTGPAFNAQPFTPITPANVTKVGTMQVRFDRGDSGILTYSVDGASVTKPITRQVFSSPLPACSS